jgi:hypothetical protein
MVTVPEVRLEIKPIVKDIVVKKQAEKYLNEPELLAGDEIVSMG